MTESLKETITRMESELKDMRAKVKEDADHIFKAGDKVLIEAVITCDGVDDDGDVRARVPASNGRTFYLYVDPVVVRLAAEEPVEEPTTPCEKDGYKVGDEFIIANVMVGDELAGWHRGDLVRLSYDDGTLSPEFTHNKGYTRYLAINNVIKINKEDK